MPRVHDLARVRARLERDPAWSAYALGDLSPQFAHWAEWHASPDDDGIVLAYRQFGLPIVFAIGPPAAVHPLIQEIDAPGITLQVQPEILPALAPRFVVESTDAMWRMVLRTEAFRPPDLLDIEPLGPADVDALRALYADGEPAGEAPDFFSPSMLEAGMFRGVRGRGTLLAAAGTHIVAADMGICAIGNVYTRRDWRGRGLGARVTAAVAAEALARGIAHVVLNVRQRNVAARRVYERLGFVAHTGFFEGSARHALVEPRRIDR